MRYLFLTLLIFLAGCGGGSSNLPASNGQVGNLLPFDTNRVDTWTGDMHGPLTLVIASDYQLTGTWQDSTGTTWTITGTAGDLILHTNTVDLRFASGIARIFGTGKLLVARADHLTGNLSITGVGVQMTYPVDLVRQ